MDAQEQETVSDNALQYKISTLKFILKPFVADDGELYFDGYAVSKFTNRLFATVIAETPRKRLMESCSKKLPACVRLLTASGNFFRLPKRKTSFIITSKLAQPSVPMVIIQ